MNVDYDGIMLARESELNESERRLVSVLVEAMRDGEIPTVSLPTRWVICDYCEGNGGHSRRFGAITEEDWHDWDDESRHAYMSGKYDERCDSCNGSGKVLVLEENILPAEVQSYIECYRNGEHESAMERYSERMAGC